MIDLRSPADIDFLVYGSASESRIGDVAAGDLDGDGLGDLAIGEWSADRVHLFKGSPALTGTVDLAVGTADASVSGKELLGISLDIADINGDGRDDLINLGFS